MSANEALKKRAYTNILEHLVKTGRAPHFTELANALEITPDEARDVQQKANDILA